MTKPTVNTSHPPVSSSKPNRKLAWKIAPNLWISFRYAWAGITYAFVTQRNFRIQISLGAIAIFLSLALQIPKGQLAIMIVMSALVLVLELLNTALESVVDLTVKQSYHELAKIAKDCAAGAVLVAAIASVILACLLLLPPLWTLFQTLNG